jgi:hypothetical protein
MVYRPEAVCRLQSGRGGEGSNKNKPDGSLLTFSFKLKLRVQGVGQKHNRMLTKRAVSTNKLLFPHLSDDMDLCFAFEFLEPP